MGRWTPRGLQGTDRLTELQADVDDLEDEPLEVHYRTQATAAADQLRHGNVTDPTIRARLERDLAYWRNRLADASIDQHWDAGEGDRPLF